MKSVELAGAIGIMFGGTQQETLRRDLVECIAAGCLASQPRRSRGALDGATMIARQYRGPDRSIGLVPNREWFSVPRDHSRSRHGNQRP